MPLHGAMNYHPPMMTPGHTNTRTAATRTADTRTADTRTAAGNPPRGIIFDLGGTLMVSASRDAENTARLLTEARQHGLEVDPQTAAAFDRARAWMWRETNRTGRQHTARQAIERAAGELGWQADDTLFDHLTACYFAPEVAAAKLHVGARRALAALRDDGLKVGLISNASDHRHIVAIVERTGLAPWLDPIVTSAAFGRIKPAPEIFQQVLDRWRLAPKSCVMVGDDPRADIAGARAAGLRSILVRLTPDAPVPAPDSPPDAVVTELLEVPEILRRWQPA